MIWPWVRRLFSILAIVGMIAAPVAVPIGASAMATGVVTISTQMAMSAQMPCCADQQPKQMPDCGKIACPGAAACMVKCFMSGTVASAPLSAPSHVVRLIGLAAEAQLTGLAPPPLIRPPRA
jgi:hypothetical protein